jgi:hypothetical protein
MPQDLIELAQECGAHTAQWSRGDGWFIDFTSEEQLSRFRDRVRAQAMEEAGRDREKRGLRRANAIAVVFLIAIPLMAVFGPAPPWYYWLLWALSVISLWNPITTAIRQSGNSGGER